MPERSPVMQDVDKVRATFNETGTIPSDDIEFLLEKMEIADRLSQASRAYKDIAQNYITFLVGVNEDLTTRLEELESNDD